MKKKGISVKTMITVLVCAAALSLSFASSASAGTWQQEGDRWRFMDDDGSCLEDDWLFDEGHWYHFDSSGYMQTGWVADNGSWYYFLTDTGVMATGWVLAGSEWYYMFPSGEMASGFCEIDGKISIFTGDGKWMGYLEDVYNMPAGTVLTQEMVDISGAYSFFYVEEISDAVFARMWGKSYKEYCTVPREDLRYIRCLHKNEEGQIKIGELVMHAAVADTVCDIFRKLYDADYPIESMLLADDFDASDDDSIMADNTSAFNFRNVDGTDQISYHAYGLAIDINPYYNVYYIPSENYIFPPEGYLYLDRDADFPYKLVPGDLCYELFTDAGFEWGGWWTYNTDYQHFQFPLDVSY